MMETTPCGTIPGKCEERDHPEAGRNESAEELDRPLRIMQVDDFYPNYVHQFYLSHPGLSLKPSSEQQDAFLQDGFSAVHVIAPYLPPPYVAEYFVAQAKQQHIAWAREQGLRFSPTQPDWMDNIIRMRVEHFQPDVLYLADPLRCNASFLQTLPVRPRLIMSWKAADIPLPIDFSGYDVMLSNVPRILAAAESLGAAHGEMFYPGVPQWLADHVAKIPQDTDVCFVGSLFPGQHDQRIALLDSVARAATEHGFSLALHLSGNPRAITPAMQPYLKPPVFGLAMNEALRRSKISVNIGSRVNLISPTGERKADLGGDDVVNMRLFEATAGGSLLLTETMPGVTRYFEPGQEVLFYRDSQELIDLIVYYLAHEDERQVIAEAGRQRCLTDHSMQNAVQRFLGIIKKYLA